VVFITARDEPGLREEALRAAAVAFLLKPFTDEALLGGVARAVAAALE
jgi:CheY-like chemotaxis protein